MIPACKSGPGLSTFYRTTLTRWKCLPGNVRTPLLVNYGCKHCRFCEPTSSFSTTSCNNIFLIHHRGGDRADYDILLANRPRPSSIRRLASGGVRDPRHPEEAPGSITQSDDSSGSSSDPNDPTPGSRTGDGQRRPGQSILREFPAHKRRRFDLPPFLQAVLPASDEHRMLCLVMFLVLCWLPYVKLRNMRMVRERFGPDHPTSYFGYYLAMYRGQLKPEWEFNRDPTITLGSLFQRKKMPMPDPEVAALVELEMAELARAEGGTAEQQN